jgi:hypothetical protein
MFLCLDLMRERLKRNFCGLDEFVPLDKVKDLPTIKKTHIGDALGYACQFWARHLVEIPSSSWMLRKYTRQSTSSSLHSCCIGLRSSA